MEQRRAPRGRVRTSPRPRSRSARSSSSSPRGSIPRARSRSRRPTEPGGARGGRRLRAPRARRSSSRRRPRAAPRPAARRPAALAPGTARGSEPRCPPDDRDPAGLAPLRGDLRHHLRRCDAERAGQARRGPDGRLHRLRDDPRARKRVREPREVEVALVEAGALDVGTTSACSLRISPTPAPRPGDGSTRAG